MGEAVWWFEVEGLQLVITCWKQPNTFFKRMEFWNFSKDEAIFGQERPKLRIRICRDHRVKEKELGPKSATQENWEYLKYFPFQWVAVPKLVKYLQNYANVDSIFWTRILTCPSCHMLPTFQKLPFLRNLQRPCSSADIIRNFPEACCFSLNFQNVNKVSDFQLCQSSSEQERIEIKRLQQLWVRDAVGIN